jgi:hypothetical protein
VVPSADVLDVEAGLVLLPGVPEDVVAAGDWGGDCTAEDVLTGRPGEEGAVGATAGDGVGCGDVLVVGAVLLALFVAGGATHAGTGVASDIAPAPIATPSVSPPIESVRVFALVGEGFWPDAPVSPSPPSVSHSMSGSAWNESPIELIQ